MLLVIFYIVHFNILYLIFIKYILVVEFLVLFGFKMDLLGWLDKITYIPPQSSLYCLENYLK